MASTLALAATAFLSVIPNFIGIAEQARAANIGLAVISLLLVNAGLFIWLIAAYMVASKAKSTTAVVLVEGRNW